MAPSPVSPGGDTAHHAGMQSLLTAVMGLTSLGAPISPGRSSSRPTTNMASMESNPHENRLAVSATSALAAPSPPVFKKSPAGFGNFQMPFAHSPKDATKAMDQFYASGQMAAVNGAAINAPPPGYISRSRGSEAALPIPSSLSKLPVRDPVEPVAGPAKPFPETLMEILSTEEHSDIIAWLPHGRGFAILNKERFALHVLPRYFDRAKFSSFTRRMKRWGFGRVARGPEMGAYYHPGFRRDRPELVKEMRYGAGGKREGGKKKNKEKEEEGADESKKLDKQAVERQVQTSLSKKVPVDLNSEAYLHVLQSSSADNKNAKQAATARKNAAWLEKRADMLRPAHQKVAVRLNSEAHGHVPRSQANPTPRDHGRSIPLQSASRVQRRLSEIQRELLSTRSTPSRRATDCLAPVSGATAAGASSARAQSLASDSISNQRPYGAPTYDVQRMIDVERAKRALDAESIAGVAEIEREMLLTRSMPSRKAADDFVPGSGAMATGVSSARARSLANGSTSNQRPYCAPVYDVQRRIDAERAKRTLEAESIAGVAKIERELLLTRSTPFRKADNDPMPGSGAMAAGAASARARSSLNGSISSQRPYCAPAYNVQRMIDAERAKRTLEAESIARLCISRSEAIMASKVLASSKMHTDIMDAGSPAENKRMNQAATARKNPAWLGDQVDSLRPSSFPLQIPDSGAPNDPRERRIANTQRELLLPRSMLPGKVADFLAPGSGAAAARAASARALSPADGSISNQRPYSAPTHNVQGMIDAERATRTLEAESIAGRYVRQSSAPAGRADAIGAIMASKILASSKIHADIMDAVARDLYSRSRPVPRAAVPSTEFSPRRSVRSQGSAERSFTRSRPVAMSQKEREQFTSFLDLEGNE